LVYLALRLVAGIAGRKRRVGFWGFLFCSILFTPFVGLLFRIFAQHPEERRMAQSDTALTLLTTLLG
jgi:hypothetical protein